MRKIFTSLTVILALYSGNLFSQFGGTLEDRPGTFENRDNMQTPALP